MLAIEVHLLTGRYAATQYNDRSRAEWPPHPARFFSALVAALHDREPVEPDELEALRWLESVESAPDLDVDIDVDERVGRREVHSVFVPVNDVTLVGDPEAEVRKASGNLAELEGSEQTNEVKVQVKNARRTLANEEKKLATFLESQHVAPKNPSKEDLKRGVALLPERRNRQERTFPVVVPERPSFVFHWPGAEPGKHLEALRRLCDRVTRLGHSSSLVHCVIVERPIRPSLVPHKAGEYMLRVVGPGQLVRLEEAYKRHQAIDPRVLPARSQRYGEPVGQDDSRRPRSIFSDEWIVFERIDGQRPLASRGIDLAISLRRALIETHGKENLPAVLSGHDAKGNQTSEPHLAFVPLPRVGHEHADGSVQGFALVVPRLIAPDERMTLMRLLGKWESERGDKDDDYAIELGTPSDLGRPIQIRIRRVEIPDKATLNAVRWCKPSRRFVTATPIALDRHPGNLRSNIERTADRAAAEAESCIADACERIGLPRPLNVSISLAPILSGAQHVRQFAPWPSAAWPGTTRARPRRDRFLRESVRAGPGWRWTLFRTRTLPAGRRSPRERRGENLMSLSVDDFEAFHRAVHDRAPFDWQNRLLRKVVSERNWPRVLDLPTGSGKTTCIDIALFALALDASTSPAERWCPRRIAMVVDRRVVVDQAAERGRKLLGVLTTSTVHEVTAVREALASLTEADEEPLGVFTLRGGIPKDDGWARTPDQPLVIASTIDQVGSRLLIQGYGVGRGMRPVHAGLAGNDMLILLDEVHLSQPFKQTLERLGRLRERYARNGLPQRFQFTFLSATPGDTKEPRFELTSAELEPDSPLGPRLCAKKPTRIVEVSGREDLATRVAGEAKNLIEKHDVVAAVVNRIDTALAVFAALKKALWEGADVVLLTGRMRPLDRDDVLAAYRPRIATGVRTRSGTERKLVVVGTQCIEAGADFDFDAMVTESVSFDGLRQRFGRVDRVGEYKDQQGKGKAEGVIVHDKDEKDDPIYEKTITETVQWLKGKLDRRTKTVDFGSRSLLDAPTNLLAPKESAPTLLPAYLDLWSQTAPEPFAVPEPGLFLHGPRSGPEDVQIIWRADLDEAAFDSQSFSNLVVAVSAVRPSSLEAISLPFVTARRWLANEANSFEASADVEIKSDDGQRVESGGRRALRWRGDESEVVDASSIHPGDTLVVPSRYGGIDFTSRCFDPGATEEVPDLAERASLMGRGRPLLRLHPRVLAGLDLNIDREDPKVARRELAGRANDLSGWKRLWALWLGKGRKADVVPWSNGEDGWLVISGERLKAHRLRKALESEESGQASIEEGVGATTDGEDSPYIGSEVTLDDHSRHVEERVLGYAKRLGLSDNLIDDLSLAAWLHDIGKADWRFQRMLRGGSEIACYRDKGRVLAKSGMPAGAKAEHQRAQKLSGYPRGTRHEVQSLAMIEAVREQVAPKAHDLDLVIYLVASHHGHCRPFAPAIGDPKPVDISLRRHESKTFGTLSFDAVTSAHGLYRLDSGLADRFWSLVAKYGWLELCWLEAILRLADHRTSEDEAGGQT